MLTPLQLFSTAEDVPVLHSRLDALHSAWQLEHALQARWASYAVWPHGSATAELLLKRGKGWNAFGTHVGPRTLLCAEEALFLMESDRLVVYRAAGDAVPLTLHDGYASALASGVSPEQYTAFAHLCRLGFVVHRHGTPWFMDSLAESTAIAAAAADPLVDAAGAPFPPVDELGGAASEQAVAVAEAAAEPIRAAEPVLAAPAAASRAWWRSDAWPAAPASGLPLVVEPPISAAEASASAWAPRLLYDVWPPQAVFTKRRVGKPFFRVCLSTFRPPNAAETAALAAKSGNVPVKCIIVKPGIVIGFDVGVVSLTTVPKKKGNR